MNAPRSDTIAIRMQNVSILNQDTYVSVIRDSKNITAEKNVKVSFGKEVFVKIFAT